MIVIDASALSAFLLKEPGWKSLSTYLENAVSIDHIVKEVANVIWKAYYIKQMIGYDDAIKLYKILKRMININIRIEPEENYIDRAMEIALQYGITIYDSLYIALAKEKDAQLLTLDEKQRQVARKIDIKTININQVI